MGCIHSYELVVLFLLRKKDMYMLNHENAFHSFN